MSILIWGLITGILFGILLQKGLVLRYEKQLGALRLQDMTIVKFMLSAIIVGMVGIYLALDYGYLAALSVKPTLLVANIVGGLLFGIGWGLYGYCPGTAVGACGEGRWHALWGIVGMLVGAALYAEAYPFLKGTLLTWGDLGKVALPNYFTFTHWYLIGGISLFFIILCAVFEKKDM